MDRQLFPSSSSLRRCIAQPSVLAFSLAIAMPVIAAGPPPGAGAEPPTLFAASAFPESAAATNPAAMDPTAEHPALVPSAASASASASEPDSEVLQQTTLPSGQQPPPPAYPNSFIGRYQARVTATQNQQPHWVTPLVTVTPRLEQEFRTDFVHYHNTGRKEIWNYDNGKGLELIPEKHTELIFNLPPFFDRSNGESDGFGDVSFLLKERIYSRNEEHGDAIVTAFLGATIPTGKNGNGSCCAVVTPTLAVGKGWGNFDVTSTAGGSLPVTNAKGLGHGIAWNNVAQYRLAKTGTARFFWPEFETNTTFYMGGSNDGKTQTFATPGVIIGRIPLSHDASGKPGRLGFTFGAGEQIAMTHFHTANHYTVLTFRIPF